MVLSNGRTLRVYALPIYGFQIKYQGFQPFHMGYYKNSNIPFST